MLTPKETVVPMVDRLYAMRNKPPEDLQEELEKVLSLWENEISPQLDEFEAEFNRIQNSNIELKERLKELDQLMDKGMNNTAKADWEVSSAACEAIYEGYWAKLNKQSQEYLTMANYLYNLFNTEGSDFGPSVLEFGRAIENELIDKIFYGYIQSLKEQTDSMIDKGHKYGDVKSAMKSFKKNGEFYIPARTMVRYLTYLSDEEFENYYNEALKKYLASNSIDSSRVSEDTFTAMADEVFEKYRNNAAHPGQFFDEKDGRDCREKSKKVLKRFMSAVD